MLTLNESIQVLGKRVDHLAQRIANSHRDLSFDKAELSALRYAIDVMEEELARRREREVRLQIEETIV